MTGESPAPGQSDAEEDRGARESGTKHATADLVVIGGGLAGHVAALSAARARPSATVRLLAGPRDRFRTETGLIDLLGYHADGTSPPTVQDDRGETVDRREPIANPLDAIDRLPNDHRYSQLGLEMVREALGLFDDVTGDAYEGEHTEKNALLPTAFGTLVPAARYPASFATGLASDDRPMRLVEIERVPDFDAELAADRLSSWLPYRLKSSAVTTPLTDVEAPAATWFARALDDNEMRDDGRPTRTAVIDAVRSSLDIEPRVGLPAVLGVADHREIHDTFEDELTAEVFEVNIGPPSVPGQRLGRLLASALEAADVIVDRDVTVSGVETTDGEIARLSTQDRTVEASSFLLATGGVQAGGIRTDREGVREPIFDCPVGVPVDRSSWTAARFLGDHPAVQFGVETDEQLRPLAGDSPRYANLYAAGRVLESSNLVAQHATSGLALVTGYQAGQLAVEHQ